VGDLHLLAKTSNCRFNDFDVFFSEHKLRLAELLREKARLGLVSHTFVSSLDQLWWLFFKCKFRPQARLSPQPHRRGMQNFWLTCPSIQVLEGLTTDRVNRKRYRSIKKRIAKKLVKLAQRRLWVF
jgi:hypothetical protein